MASVVLNDIEDSIVRIRPYLPASAIKESFHLQRRFNRRVFLKLENFNLSGSFKIRGALNALLQMPRHKLEKGIVAASAGNHAQGVAYTCQMLKANATIFMPERSPLVKVEATKDLGADVRLIGQTYDDALDAARKFVSETNGTLLHGFDDPHVIAGQGTIGLELLNQIPNLSMIVASVGGGGLLAGIAVAVKTLKPQVKIIGVQSSAFPGMAESIKSGSVIATAGGFTIADGIAVKKPSAITAAILAKTVDQMILLNDDEIAAAVMNLMEWEHMLAEGSGAAPIAALSTAELKVKRVWAQKMLARIQVDDLEGRYRRHWLVMSLLEDYFLQRGLWYMGPKGSFQWFTQHDTAAALAFAKVLRLDGEFADLEALVALVHNMKAC